LGIEGSLTRGWGRRQSWRWPQLARHTQAWSIVVIEGKCNAFAGLGISTGPRVLVGEARCWMAGHSGRIRPESDISQRVPAHFQVRRCDSLKWGTPDEGKGTARKQKAGRAVLNDPPSESLSPSSPEHCCALQNRC